MLVIRGGHVIDPGHLNGVYDIFVAEGIIVDVVSPGANPEHKSAPAREINAAGKIVAPGLIDMHVHLREPGEEYKETVATGCRAAARGGFTTICPMPNTNPVNDRADVCRFIQNQAVKSGVGVRVRPVGAISRGLEGAQLAEYGDLKDAGAVAVSDDGRPVSDGQLMRRALEYAQGFGLPVVSHCEELALVDGGAMNEGPVSTRLGLPGIPNIAESAMVERDIALCELTGGNLHIAHVSTRESVRALRWAKQRGVRVTAETAPHFLALTDEAVGQYDTAAKVNPPLRASADREAVREALADGTIDAIASDHAPHSVLEKEGEFALAANGISGLETSLGLALWLVHQKLLSMEDLIERMSLAPARILGLSSGLNPGDAADVTIIDPDDPWTVTAADFCSLGKNTPFEGWALPGRAVMTIVGGTIVFDGFAPGED